MATAVHHQHHLFLLLLQPLSALSRRPYLSFSPRRAPICSSFTAPGCHAIALAKAEWKQQQEEEEAQFVVVTFYKFVPLEDPRAEVARHLHFLQVLLPASITSSRFFFLDAETFDNAAWSSLCFKLLQKFSPFFSMCCVLFEAFKTCASVSLLHFLNCIPPTLYQGRDIHGRIYLNEQGINAQVSQSSAPLGYNEFGVTTNVALGTAEHVCNQTFILSFPIVAVQWSTQRCNGICRLA